MEKFALKGITHGESFDLGEGLISIGRNPTNDFRVHDPTVSSFHCELIVSGKTVLVRDPNSTTSTHINDEPVQEAFIQPWQTLRLGQAELRLEVEETQEVSIRIPEVDRTEPATHLLDGRLACRNHPGVAAVVKCTACEESFCADCVTPIGIKGGQKRLFCPSCSKPCLPIATSAEKPEKRSFLGRLTQTIRIRMRNR